MKIEFFRHNIDEQDINEVIGVLKSLTLTTGESTYIFEEELCKYTGAVHAIGMTSCTAALHLSLQALDIGPGDQVITTPLTFAATLSSIIHAGAEPVLVDVEESTGNLDLNEVEKKITSKTKAIMPVHLFGLMCDMKEIRTIADRKGLKIVEDAAHCLEGSRDGIRPGELSDTACFSFYANKSITSGEGGAVITNDDYLAERLRRLRLHGLEKKAESRYSNKYQPYDILELGWKYNMDNIQAALLINQLKRINALRERKEKIWKMYVDSFSGENMLRLQKVGSSVEHAMHIFNIRTDIEIRNALIHHLEKKGIGVSVHFIPAHQLTFFRKTFGWKEGMFPKAEEFSKRSISLPIYPGLKTEEAKYIIETVIEGIHEIAT